MSFGGNGASGSCITGSLRYSADEGNVAERGTDGGLFVPGGGGGGGGDRFIAAFHTPASEVDVNVTLVDGVGQSIAPPDDTFSIVNGGTTPAVVMLTVKQPLLLTCDPGATGTIVGALTVTVTGDVPGMIVDQVDFNVSAPAGGDYRDFPISTIAFEISGSGTASVTIGTVAIATTDGGGGAAQGGARVRTMIAAGA